MKEVHTVQATDLQKIGRKPRAAVGMDESSQK